MGNFPVEAGDGVLIYTDGVFEVSSSEHEEFGEQRLRDAIQRRVALPLDKIFNEVVGEIHEFSSGGFDDDVCIVGVEVTLKEPRHGSGGLGEVQESPLEGVTPRF
jgi:serine phosphatase RsbU (regulator of sigma subunit)